MSWNPEQYHMFQQQRFAPFEDLVDLIEIDDGMSVVDLGCGTGELTAQLADLLPDSDVLGIDSSDAMLSRAQPLARPGLRFEKGMIEAVEGQWDLVFSHAAIQWVDDHHSLIPQLIKMVKPGGLLAVQLPSNHDHPSHTLAHAVAGEEPFRSALNGWVRQVPVLTLFEYAELLYAHGGPDLVIYEKAYPHLLKSADAIAEWTKGTLLVPYLSRLPEKLKEPFMDEYRRRLRERWPNGPVFYPFKRTLFAVKRER